jgi:membrane-bound ClpP family serine protease
MRTLTGVIGIIGISLLILSTVHAVSEDYARAAYEISLATLLYVQFSTNKIEE